ncbi:MAG: aspartate/glutamate racemase family protein [Acidimicrobiia bacterium]
MKRIGVLGGMSWQSTISYYRYLNEEANTRLGGLHSADLLIWSGDFAPIAEATRTRDWDNLARILCAAAKELTAQGAELLVIAANAAHAVSDVVEAYGGVPVVNIIDVTAHRIQDSGITNAALLGTAAVMEEPFYRERMADNGVEVITPPESARAEINRIVFEELVQGVVDDGSHRTLVDTIDLLADQGAEGTIFGCTELSMILDEDDGVVPGFDTTRIHAVAAVEAALMD